MLKRLHLRNFTVFEDANFEFGPGLNVIVGANGTGKSHVLKVGYTVIYCILDKIQKVIISLNNQYEASRQEIALNIESELEYKLRNVFQQFPTSTSLLNRGGRHATPAKVDAEMICIGSQIRPSVAFSSGYIKAPTLPWPSSVSNRSNISIPVFIPAKEVLTMGWLLPLYNLRKLPVDETYPDLLQLLSVPALKLPTSESLGTQVQLMNIISGTVEEEGGHFYLSAPEQPRMEMNLVAEGFRKFATLYKLLANGTLTPETTLFWDEPEANLNPALLKDMAAVLTELAKAGFQIILATHSLFLLKELHILARQEHKPVRYFGLSAQPGEATTVATADDLELLPNIVALDAELEQSDRFQRILDQEDANGN